MSTIDASRKTLTSKIFIVTIVITMGIVVFRSAVAIAQGTALVPAAMDDLMRLVSVRDLILGQSWFDMTQYRVLGGDGLSLHWSRYVDAGIGLFLMPLLLVLPGPVAEQVAAVLWPMTLTIALIGVVAFGTRRLLGNTAGAIAAFTVLTYPLLMSGYFQSGRLDHHNVQILLISLACVALTMPNHARFWGVVGGLAAGLSLAVSVEMLFAIVAISVLHVTDFARARTGSETRLGGYCLTLIVSATVLFLGQTPQAEWALNHCDEIAPPFLAIAGIGAVAALAPLLLPSAWRRPIFILGSTIFVAGFGMFLSWDLVEGCIRSPYGNLPQETQDFISNDISEALSLIAFTERQPEIAIGYFGPGIVGVLGATFFWLRSRNQKGDETGVGHIIIIGWVGLIASFWQVRQVILVASVLPFIMGYFLDHFVQLRQRNRSMRTQLTLLLAFAATLFQSTLVTGVSTLLASTQDATKSKVTWGLHDHNCLKLDELATLNQLEPGPLLTSLNVGPALIVATHHIALAAPYHRSNEALTNAAALTLEDPAKFRAALDTMGTKRFMVCQNNRYGSETSIGTQLASGKDILGFSRRDVGRQNLMVFDVEPTL